MTPTKFKNPRNFCVGDSPLRIDMCFNLLGANDRQLLYFLFLPITSRIYEIADFELLIVARFIWKD